MQPPITTPTALILIDLQLGLTYPRPDSPTHSTPYLEANISALLSAARAHRTAQVSHPIHIIHIHHHSIETTSKLHPSHIMTGSPIPEYNGRKGIDPMPCAQPIPGEPVMVKHVNSGFIGTRLEEEIRGRGVKQVVVVGMTTVHCVSTTTRMAANLNVVGDPEGMGERGIVLVEDGCACFGIKGRDGRVWDAETVHAVEIGCLEGEFAKVVKTEEVLTVLKACEM